MSITRQLVFRLCAGLFVLTMLFPPFIVQIGNHHIGCGYGFLFSWPKSNISDSFTCQVDTAFLLAQWLFIAAIGGAAAYTIKEEAPAITINIPGRKIIKMTLYVLLVIAMAFTLGAISKGNSTAQIYSMLAKSHLVATNVAATGIVFLAIGYCMSAAWSRIRKRFFQKESSTLSKLAFGFCIGVLIAIAIQNGKTDSGHFVFDGEAPANGPWSKDWSQPKPQ